MQTKTRIVASLVAVSTLYFGAFYDRRTERVVPTAQAVDVTTHPTQPRVEQRSSLQEQQAQLRSNRADLDRRISEMEAKLLGLQAPPAKQAATDAISKDTKTGTIAESELAAWMDDGLRSERPDTEQTAHARRQITESLAGMPKTRLDDVVCGERFCRAAFAGDDGQPPALSSLFGIPPFEREGFTISEPDGRVAIYFTREGASLTMLRDDALAAATTTP